MKCNLGSGEKYDPRVRGVGGENENFRPDLSSFNMPGTNKKVIADIQVTCPIPAKSGSNISVTEALKKGRAAKHARDG